MKIKEYYGLHNLSSILGNKKKKRLGRGEGSGLGKTCGRGNKGQKARKSGTVRVGFEGGQNPLYKRLPKYRFNNFLFRKKIISINLETINNKYIEDELVDKHSLLKKGIINKNNILIKILGDGDLNFKLKFYVDFVSKNAAKKISESGGKITLIK